MPCRDDRDSPSHSDVLFSENYQLKQKVDQLETELCILREYLLNHQEFDAYKLNIIREAQLEHRREDVEIMIQRELEIINSRTKSLKMYKGTDFEQLFDQPLKEDIYKAERKISILRNLTDEQLLNRVYLDNKYYL